jgi:hypothetical protein
MAVYWPGWRSYTPLSVDSCIFYLPLSIFVQLISLYLYWRSFSLAGTAGVFVQTTPILPSIPHTFGSYAFNYHFLLPFCIFGRVLCSLYQFGRVKNVVV